MLESASAEQPASISVALRRLPWLYRVLAPLRRLSPVRQFQLVSLLILLCGMLGVGWWLGQKIEERVIWHTVNMNALYVESLLAPMLHDLNTTRALAPAEVSSLSHLLTQTPLQQRIPALILWDSEGQVLYSSNETQIGHSFPVDEDLINSFAGTVSWEVVETRETNHIPLREGGAQLLAIYTPLREVGTGRIIAVVEFYQAFDGLLNDITLAQHET